MSTETWLWIAVVALIVWSGFQQALLHYHQCHLAAHDQRMDAHQRSLDAHDQRMDAHRRSLDAHSQHLATHSEALRLRSITPISTERLTLLKDGVMRFDAKLHDLESSDGD